MQFVGIHWKKRIIINMPELLNVINIPIYMHWTD